MKRSICVALVATLSILGACGDDDDASPTTGDPSSDESTTTTAAEGEGDGEQAAGDGDFCTGYTELLAGDPAPEEIRALVDVAPEDAKEPLETIATGFEEDPEAFFDTEEFNQAFAALGDAATAECADETFEVTAVDYAFEGIPEEIPAGRIGVSFANEGTEFHEMVVFRKNDDTAESFDEIFALEDQDAAQALVSEAGATFAPPGGSSSGLFDVSEPGEYVAVCFIPVGTTPEAEEGSGPPHFTQGMKAEFTVTG